MQVGIKYTSKPGEQFTIRKTVYQSVLAMFKENGIHMASRNVKVDVPDDATPEQKKEAIAAAAQHPAKALKPEAFARDTNQKPRTGKQCGAFHAG